MNINKIERLESDLCKGFPQLQELKLNDNEIETIDDNAFRTCVNLRILTLQNNKISQLHSGMVSTRNRSGFFEVFFLPLNSANILKIMKL